MNPECVYCGKKDCNCVYSRVSKVFYELKNGMPWLAENEKY